MLEAVIRAHQEVRIRIVHGLTERNDVHSERAHQGHALIDHQVMKPGAASRFELVRPDLD